MGRTNADVKAMAAMIPKGTLSQSIWKDEVCIRYKSGESVSVAMHSATAARRKIDPAFEPTYERDLLSI